MFPSTSPTQVLSDAVILAKGLSKASGPINRPRVPARKEFEAMADHISAAGYYSADELIDTSDAQRAQLQDFG